MGRKCTVAVVLAVAAAAGLVWSHGTGTTSPNSISNAAFSFEPSEIDLGEVPLHESKSFTVILRNNSAKLAVVHSISAGCACTDVQAVASEIAAGGTTVVNGVYLGTRNSGKIELQMVATVNSDKIRLPIRGRAYSEIDVTPQTAVISYNPIEGTSASTELTIRNRSFEAVAVSTSSLPAGFVITGRDRLELSPGESATVTFVYESSNVCKSQTIISLATTHAKYKVVTVPVMLSPIPGLTLVPRNIHLGVISTQGTGSHRRFTIKIIGQLLNQLDHVGTKCPSGIRLVDQRRDSSGVDAVFEFDAAELTCSSFDDSINWTFQHKEAGVIVVPVRVCAHVMLE